MRGIGAGQRVHLFIIPEVHDLIGRELRAAGRPFPPAAAAPRPPPPPPPPHAAAAPFSDATQRLLLRLAQAAPAAGEAAAGKGSPSDRASPLPEDADVGDSASAIGAADSGAGLRGRW